MDETLRAALRALIDTAPTIEDLHQDRRLSTAVLTEDLEELLAPPLTQAEIIKQRIEALWPGHSAHSIGPFTFEGASMTAACSCGVVLR